MPSTIREDDVERYLVDQVAKCGGRCPKWTSPGTPGVPDRIVLLRKAKIVFVELKAPGEKPRPIQNHVMGWLKNMGFKVRVIDSKKQVDALLKELKVSPI